jgi:hypothetical protein
MVRWMGRIMTKVKGSWAECPEHSRRSYDCVGVNTFGVLFRCKGDSLIPNSYHTFVVPQKNVKRQRFYGR